MTLYKEALTLIQSNLEIISNGKKATAVEIGEFTLDQHNEINTLRAKINLPPLQDAKIVFIGGHLYKSRVTQDGYSIADVLAQIVSAFADTSEIIHTSHMTGLKSTIKREDGYGNKVLDEAIFELTQRKPKAELYSVIPKGDHLKVKNKK
jgi:hypothetical protein